MGNEGVKDLKDLNFNNDNHDRDKDHDHNRDNDPAIMTKRQNHTGQEYQHHHHPRQHLMKEQEVAHRLIIGRGKKMNQRVQKKSKKMKRIKMKKRRRKKNQDLHGD